MRHPGALSGADLADWADYARQVAPLPGRRAPERPRSAEPALSPGPAARAGGSRRVRLAASPLRIGDQPPGVDSATWTRFRTGRLPPARTLDLHGHGVHGAYRALRSALRSAQAERLRCIEVITGRGSGEAGGVIRRELPLWLNLPELRPLVLAAAHPHPANPGATRLLLRRAR